MLSKSKQGMNYLIGLCPPCMNPKVFSSKSLVLYFLTKEIGYNSFVALFGLIYTFFKDPDFFAKAEYSKCSQHPHFKF